MQHVHFMEFCTADRDDTRQGISKTESFQFKVRFRTEGLEGLQTRPEGVVEPAGPPCDYSLGLSPANRRAKMRIAFATCRVARISGSSVSVIASAISACALSIVIQGASRRFSVVIRS